MPFWDISYHPPTLYRVPIASIFGKTNLYVLRNWKLKGGRTYERQDILGEQTSWSLKSLLIPQPKGIKKGPALSASKIGDIQESHSRPEEIAFVKVYRVAFTSDGLGHYYTSVYFGFRRGKNVQGSNRFGIWNMLCYQIPYSCSFTIYISDLEALKKCYKQQEENI